MKKFLSIILAMTVMFSLAACDNSGDETKCADDETLVAEACVKNSDINQDLLDGVKDEFTLPIDLTQVVTDLTLPTTEGDVAIAWESSNTEVLANDGSVTPSMTEDTVVTLTATLSYEGLEVTKAFEVTVLKHQEEPVLAVLGEVVTMNAGDADSLEGATATDANDGDISENIRVIGTWDINTPGIYDVTLFVTDSDGQSDSTKATLIVNYSDPVVVTGETWGVEPEEVKSLVIFDVVLDVEDGDIYTIEQFGGAITGPTLFQNLTGTEITFTVTNAYAVAAILDANGVVIEGRDGANGRLVDDSCGLRTLCQQGSIDAGNPLADLTVPAGGFVIVAPNTDSDYNEDGRKFVNEQVIGRLQRVIPLNVNDESIYDYADQAPFVVMGGKVKPTGSFTLTGTAGVAANFLEELMIYDDGGVLGGASELVAADAITSVTLWDEYGTEYDATAFETYVFENQGTYDVEIVITDGTNSRTIETQITVIVFEELATPAFRISGTIGETEIEYIDLMKVPYTYNFKDTDDIDTATYHLYDDYTQLLNDTTSAPHAMGWASWLIFDKETGIIEANYNIFHGNLYVAAGVTYVDPSLATADNQGLQSITDLPEGKVLLVGPQGTDLRAFALSSTSRDLTGTVIEFINVPEVPSIMPSYELPTLVINHGETPFVIDISTYAYDEAVSGTNNMPTGTVRVVTDYNNILGLDGTPLNMGWGSYMVIDELSGEVEVYANWANIFKAEGVDYVAETVNAAEVLDSLTSLPAGKILIVSPQGTTLRDELHNSVGSNTDFTGSVVGIYEVYANPAFMISYDGTNYSIDITGYSFDEAVTGTNNMPTSTVRVVTDYNNILGLDGTPLNMGWGSYVVIDAETGVVEVYANWGTVHILDGVDYVNTTVNGAEVLDTLNSLPEGKILIVNPQGTDMRDTLYNSIGSNTDITGLVVKIVKVDELNN